MQGLIYHNSANASIRQQIKAWNRLKLPEIPKSVVYYSAHLLFGKEFAATLQEQDQKNIQTISETQQNLLENQEIIDFLTCILHKIKHQKDPNEIYSQLIHEESQNDQTGDDQQKPKKMYKQDFRHQIETDLTDHGWNNAPIAPYIWFYAKLAKLILVKKAKIQLNISPCIVVSHLLQQPVQLFTNSSGVIQAQKLHINQVEPAMHKMFGKVKHSITKPSFIAKLYRINISKNNAYKKCIQKVIELYTHSDIDQANQDLLNAILNPLFNQIIFQRFVHNSWVKVQKIQLYITQELLQPKLFVISSIKRKDSLKDRDPKDSIYSRISNVSTASNLKSGQSYQDQNEEDKIVGRQEFTPLINKQIPAVQKVNEKIFGARKLISYQLLYMIRKILRKGKLLGLNTPYFKRIEIVNKNLDIVINWIENLIHQKIRKYQAQSTLKQVFSKSNQQVLQKQKSNKKELINRYCITKQDNTHIDRCQVSKSFHQYIYQVRQMIKTVNEFYLRHQKCQISEMLIESIIGKNSQMIIIEVKACKFNEAKIAKLDRNKSVEFKPNKDLVCKGDYCKLLKNPFTRQRLMCAIQNSIMHRNAENISIFHSENPYLSDAVKFRIIRKSIIDDRVNKNSLMSKIRQQLGRSLNSMLKLQNFNAQKHNAKLKQMYDVKQKQLGINWQMDMLPVCGICYKIYMQNSLSYSNLPKISNFNIQIEKKKQSRNQSVQPKGKLTQQSTFDKKQYKHEMNKQVQNFRRSLRLKANKQHTSSQEVLLSTQECDTYPDSEISMQTRVKNIFNSTKDISSYYNK